MLNLKLWRLLEKLSPDHDSASDIYTAAAVSYADQFPHVPEPEDNLSLLMIAARWLSHDLYGEDMPGVAAELLEIGHDTPTLRWLAGETEIQSSADAEPLVARVFHELGVQYPISGRQAKLIYTRQIAREVIAGQRNAWAAANHLEIVVWNWIPPTEKLSALFLINDEIDWDPVHRRPIADLNTELIATFVQLATLQDGEILSTVVDES